MTPSTINPSVSDSRNNMNMIKTLTGIATISGLLIVCAYTFTLPRIKFNKAEYLKKACFIVLPNTVRTQPYKVNPDGTITKLVTEDEKSQKVYAGYNANNELTGIAIQAQGQGFQDVIGVIYGYSPEKKAIVGFKVLASKETPGLGDKIDVDQEFLNNFKELDVKLLPDNSALAHPIEVVKKGKKVNPWQIDSITGATISSKAVGKLLDKSTSSIIPIIEKNLQQMKEEK